MTEYETTVVVRPDIGGDAIEATLDKVRDAVKGRGGKLLAIDHWGKKKLAYPIKKHSRGIYVHTHYLGIGDTVAEVERHLRISDSVLRFLTIRMGEGVDPGTRDEKEYVVPQYDVEESVEGEEAVAQVAEGEGAATEGEASSSPAGALGDVGAPALEAAPAAQAAPVAQVTATAAAVKAAPGAESAAEKSSDETASTETEKTEE